MRVPRLNRIRELFGLRAGELRRLTSKLYACFSRLLVTMTLAIFRAAFVPVAATAIALVTQFMLLVLLFPLLLLRLPFSLLSRLFFMIFRRSHVGVGLKFGFFEEEVDLHDLVSPLQKVLFVHRDHLVQRNSLVLVVNVEKHARFVLTSA